MLLLVLGVAGVVPAGSSRYRLVPTSGTVGVLELVELDALALWKCWYRRYAPTPPPTIITQTSGDLKLMEDSENPGMSLPSTIAE
jgi:hypothetical protein